MLPPFTYMRPETPDEVTRHLDESDGARILAGGTDLLVGMRSGESAPDRLIDIKRIPELRTLALDDGRLRIGAAVRVNELLESRDIIDRYPVLAEAGRRMASHQIRNRATVVGNLCNASPAADMAAALLALDAEVRILGPGGERRLPLEAFFTGCKTCALERGEWVTSVDAQALPPGTRSGFLKHGRVKGPDLSTVNCAAAFHPDGSLTLVLGAVAPTPVKIRTPDGRRRDAVLSRICDSVRPIDDVRGSAEYRKDVACVLARRLLDRWTGSPGGG